MNNDGLDSGGPNEVLEDASRDIRSSQSSNPGILTLDRIQDGSEMALDVGEGESLDGIDQQAKLSYVPVAEEGQRKAYTGNNFIGKKSKKRIIVAGGVVCVLILMTAGLTLGGFFRDKEEPIRPVSNISSEDLAKLSEKSVQDANQVTINGALQLNNRFVVTPSAKPQNAEAGQIYFDKESNKFLYYDGQQYQGITNDQSVDQLTMQLQELRNQLTETSRSNPGNGLQLVGGVMSNAGVLSIQGTRGDVTFNAGPGINVQGLTITNTGVTALSGTANQITVSAANGAVKLSLPQNISVTSSPNFAGMTLASALGISSGGTGATSFTTNGVVYFNGTNLVSTGAASTTGLCLISTASGPEFGSCSGAPSSGVTTLGSILTTGTKYTNGGLISGSTLSLQTADASYAGLVSTAAQTFAGVKTFNDDIEVAASKSIKGLGALTLQSANNTDLTLTASGTGRLVFTGLNCSGNANGGKLTVDVNGRVSCADDTGAGPAGANTTLSNLTSPTSLNQDLIASADNTRDLGSSAIKFKNLYLAGTVNGTTVSGTSIQGSGSGDFTVSAASSGNRGLTLASAGTGNLTLSKNSGNIVLSGMNCSGFGNNGKLTVDGSGILMCGADTGGDGVGISSVSNTNDSITVDNTDGSNPKVSVRLQGNGGLITTAGQGVGLTTTCNSGQLLKYGGALAGWECADDEEGEGDGVGVTTLGSILTTGTKYTNGGLISGSTLSLQTADASYAGLVSTAAQTFAGVKTFNDDIEVAASKSIKGLGALTLQSANNTDLTLTASGTGRLVFTGLNCSGNANGGKLTVDVNGRVSCADDTGAGPAGANTTLSNLTSPTSLNQDLIASADNTRDLGSSAIKFKNLYLAGTVNGTTVSGTSIQGSGSGDFTVSAASSGNRGLTLASAGTGNLTLSKNSGNIVLSGMNCSGFGNNGKLTVDGSGILMCGADTGGDGVGISSVSNTNDSITVDNTDGSNPKVSVRLQGNGGLITTAGQGVGLTTTCNSGQLLKYGGALAGWECADDEDSGATAGDILHKGNLFGEDMVIGTNDNYALNFETNNSVKMTILANGNVGIGETSPAAKLHVNGGSMLVQGTFGGGNGITVTGAGTRMFFDTNKAAFRAGDVTGTQWNDTNVGAYSVAMGGDTTASGMYSTALGYGTTASGHYSTALGFNATAQAFASTVVGRYNLIQGNASGWTAGDPLFVVGNGTDAGNRSNALTVLKNGNMLVGGSEIQKTGSGFDLNILDAGDSTLRVTNSGAGVANLNIVEGSLQTNEVTRLTNNGTLQNVNIVPNSTVTVGSAMGILFTNASGVVQSLSVTGQTGNCVGYDGANIVFQSCSGSGGGGTGFNNGGNVYTTNPGTATTRIATSYDAVIANPVLGLSSNSALDIITNNSSRINISNAGDVKILSNSGNSTEKLSVRTQNTGDASRYINSLTVDTSSDTLGRVGVGLKVGSAPQVRLDIGGNFTGSGSTSNGGIQIGASAAPGLSVGATLGGGSVATGRIYFDELTGKFKVSENGNAWVDLIQGGGVPSFTRNGNSFGQVATLGTTDSYDLRVIMNNTEKLRFDTSNNITFKTGGVIDFSDANGNNPLLRVDRNGNSVLVGTTTSDGGSKLNVGGNINATGYKVNGSSGLSLSCGSGQQALGAFTFTGGILTSGSCQPNTSDLAEAYNSSDALEPAELVMAAGTSVTSVSRATVANKGALMGIVSTAPSQTLGTHDVPNGYPIALTGRVPTKVTTESGAIAVGDKITISSIPGVGKKATTAGMVVGTAMESYDGSGVGSIEVFVHLMYYNPVDGNHLQAESGTFGTLNISGEATIEKLVVTNRAEFKGDIVLGGHLVTSGGIADSQPEAAAGTGAVVTLDGNDTAGTITLTTGSGTITAGDLATVTFNRPYTKTPKIILSGQDDRSLAARIFPANKSLSTFKLKTEQILPPNTTYTFDYVIVE